jgi:hypothetical protein
MAVILSTVAAADMAAGAVRICVLPGNAADTERLVVLLRGGVHASRKSVRMRQLPRKVRSPQVARFFEAQLQRGHSVLRRLACEGSLATDEQVLLLELGIVWR